MYTPELEIKDTTESNTSVSYLDLLLSIDRDGQLRTSLYDNRDDFNFHIQIFRSHLRPPMAFLSHNSSDTPGLAPLINVIPLMRAVQLSIGFSDSDMSRNVWNRLLRSYMIGTEILPNNMMPPLPNVTRHSGWWPYTVTPSIDETSHQFLTLLVIWTLLPNLTFYLIVQG